MKSLRWDLSALYKSFDSEEFKNDFVKLEDTLKEMNEWAEKELSNSDNAKEKIEKYIEDIRSLNKLAYRIFSFAHLTLSVDSRNEKAKLNVNRFRNLSGDFTKLDVKFNKFIKEIKDLDSIIAGSDLLKEHEFYLKEIKTFSEHMLSENEEVIIAKMRNTGSSAFSTLQGDLTANLMIEVELDGEKKILPLPAIRNLAFSDKAEVRKKAFEAEIENYKRIEESSAASLNAIKGEVITVSELKGFKDPIEETLLDSRMNKKTLDSLWTAINEYLPYFHKYLRRKGEILGHKNGLPFYDLVAPIGETSRTFTYDEAIEYIVENFKKFSPRLANYVQHAYDNEWLDVEPREGKRGGAFCSNLHTIGESRIMANFNGSFSNMTTLAHELGHGYHGFNLKDESILNSSYPMPIAETASIFNETIVTNAALKEANKEEQLAIIEAMVSDANQVIVDIYSRFLFEREVFDRRKTHTLSVKEIKEVMTDAQKKAYGDGLDHEVLHPYMWACKPHYYSAGLSFYNFPYAFGLLFAKGLYAKYLEMGEDFLPLYDELLRKTGKMNISDLTKSVGIDIETPDFFRSSLEIIKKDIEKFMELTEGMVK